VLSAPLASFPGLDEDVKAEDDRSVLICNSKNEQGRLRDPV